MQESARIAGGCRLPARCRRRRDLRQLHDRAAPRANRREKGGDGAATSRTASTSTSITAASSAWSGQCSRAGGWLPTGHADRGRALRQHRPAALRWWPRRAQRALSGARHLV